MALNNADLADLKKVMKEVWDTRMGIQSDIMTIESTLQTLEKRNNDLLQQIIAIKTAIED